MFDLMFGLDRVDPKERRLVKAEGDSLEELLVAWLNEVLYAHAADKMLFSRFTDAELSGNFFSAWGWGERMDSGLHVAEMEIKAATYHGLAFRRTEAGWAATIIFDV